MTLAEKIDESHGLWELAVVRLATAVECGADRKFLKKLSLEERKSYELWSNVSTIAVQS